MKGKEKGNGEEAGGSGKKKMALYEHFTIPSHRFMHSSERSASKFIPKGTGGYTYHPHYLASTIAYAASSDAPSGPSHVAASGSGRAMAESEDESQRVPGAQRSVATGALGIPVVLSHTSGIQATISSKKDEDNEDFRVPIFSAQGLKNSSVDKGSNGDVGKAQQSCKRFTTDRRASSSVTNSPMNMQSSFKMKSPDRCNMEQSSNARAVPRTKGHLSDADPASSQGFSSHYLVSHNKKGLFPVETTIAFHSSSSSRLHALRSVGKLSQSNIYGEINSSKQKITSAVVAISAVDNAVMEKEEEPMRHEVYSREVETSNSKHGNVFSRNCEYTGDSETFSIKGLKTSEPLYLEGDSGDDSNSSMLELVSLPKIAPKDAVKAFGQQQFWKARRSILKQQKIFSDQVFELHKLVKVQQLLAATPNVRLEDNLINESHVGTSGFATSISMSTPGKADKKATEDQAHLFAHCSNEPSKDFNPLGQGMQPSLGCYSAWFGSNGTQGLNYGFHNPASIGSYPTPPPLVHAGVGAWSYPYLNLGMNHFSGPVPGAGPFLYQPFTGGCPPAPSFGGLPFAMPAMIPPFGLQGTVQHLPLSYTLLPPNLNQPLVPTGSTHTDLKQKSVDGIPSGSIASNSHQPTTAAGPNFPLQCVNNLKAASHIEESDSLSPSDAQQTGSDNTIDDECTNKGWIAQEAYHSSSGHHANESSLTDWESKRYREQRAHANREADQGHTGNSLALFPLAPASELETLNQKKPGDDGERCGQVIKVVPRAASTASRSTAGILRSLEQERYS